MDSFIRAVEVWLPVDGVLIHGGGLYPSAARLERISRELCFGRAEGLPGRAWDAGHPLVLHRFEPQVFRRTAEAAEAGLECAVALPIHRDGELTSVAVLLCGAPAQSAGALEVWHNNPRVTTDLSLYDGLFGADAEGLATLARDGFLPRGAGLPGLAWQRGAAVFMDRLEGNRHFLRAQTAAHAGVARGIALPCAARDDQVWVLSLLSGAAAPLVGRLETWIVDAPGGHVARAAGFCTHAGVLGAGPPVDAAAARDGAVGLAQACQRAVVVRDLAAASDPCTADAARAGWSGVLALPVGDDGSEVVALYL
jgi:hypothetical protein